MPLSATAWVRKMRGGSQAHMIVAEDGHSYVVKCKQNAQHRRILVNEWAAGILLEHLGIPTAKPEIILLNDEFLSANSELKVVTGSHEKPVLPGWHFGSRVPVDPSRFVLYDYLPDALLSQVANLRDFLGALVFDKWVHNADSRQCVFFRAQIRHYSDAPATRKTGFVAMMMDHGYIFGGPEWKLEDTPVSGLYPRHLVYREVRGLDSFQPWLDLATNVPLSLLDTIGRSMPEWWLNGDRTELDKLLEGLWRRRARLPHLLEDMRNVRGNPFPNW
ncbi:MAG: hypothetical protein HYZ37_13370 [Candidatus Solibacter usitatus]|nr:hypothetical protein [Candidatus Solibacter usitatus]